jgi:hypothetical protein
MVPLAEALQRPIQRASLGHRADVIDVIGLGTQTTHMGLAANQDERRTLHAGDA